MTGDVVYDIFFAFLFLLLRSNVILWKTTNHHALEILKFCSWQTVSIIFFIFYTPLHGKLFEKFYKFQRTLGMWCEEHLSGKSCFIDSRDRLNDLWCFVSFLRIYPRLKMKRLFFGILILFFDLQFTIVALWTK